MKNKILLILTISLIIIGLVQAIPAIAGESPDVSRSNEKRTTTTINDLRGERNSVQNKEQLESLAKQYGVSLESKSLETIQQELRDTLIQEKAKELGISTEGKTRDELEVELKNVMGEYKNSTEESELFSINEYRLELGSRDKMLTEKAAKMGIKTDNKDTESIQQEILDQLLRSKANELGIKAEDTNLEAIEAKLKEAVDSRK